MAVAATVSTMRLSVFLVCLFSCATVARAETADIYFYVNAHKRVVYVNELERIPAAYRKQVRRKDLSHISLNSELARDLRAASRARQQAAASAAARVQQTHARPASDEWKAERLDIQAFNLEAALTDMQAQIEKRNLALQQALDM
jgi:hypothetical protein